MVLFLVWIVLLTEVVVGELASTAAPAGLLLSHSPLLPVKNDVVDDMVTQQVEVTQSPQFRRRASKHEARKLSILTRIQQRSKEQLPVLASENDGVLCVKDGERDEKRCNMSNMERCVFQQERISRCTCLQGYARTGDGSSHCMPVRHYRGTLVTWLKYDKMLKDKTSELYRLLEFDAKNALFKVLKSSRLWSVMVDVQVVGFTKTSNGNIGIYYDILLPSPYATDPALVRRDVIEGVVGVVTSSEFNDMYVLLNSTVAVIETDLLVTTEDIHAINITNVDPCGDVLLNYCDVTAVCNSTSYGTFFCSCQPGYIDASPDIENAPGERCISAMCSDEICQYRGQCTIDNATRQPSCQCSSWYVGPTCSIDVTVLLVVTVVLVVLFTSVTLSVVVYLFRRRHRRRQSISSSFASCHLPHGGGSESQPSSAVSVAGSKIGWKDTDTWQFCVVHNQSQDTTTGPAQLLSVYNDNDYGSAYYAYGSNKRNSATKQKTALPDDSSSCKTDQMTDTGVGITNPACTSS